MRDGKIHSINENGEEFEFDTLQEFLESIDGYSLAGQIDSEDLPEQPGEDMTEEEEDDTDDTKTQSPSGNGEENKEKELMAEYRQMTAQYLNRRR